MSDIRRLCWAPGHDFTEMRSLCFTCAARFSHISRIRRVSGGDGFIFSARQRASSRPRQHLRRLPAAADRACGRRQQNILRHEMHDDYAITFELLFDFGYDDARPRDARAEGWAEDRRFLYYRYPASTMRAKRQLD